MADNDFVRGAWKRYEAIHDVIYFGSRLREHGAALGLRGFWMSYFAFRAAPVGAVGTETVTALFYGFHRDRVSRAVPDAWARTTAEEAIAAREAAADEAIRDLVDPTDVRYRVDEAAELAWAAAQAADCAGRPLTAANQALARPRSSHVALWQATSVLREHRGDGHNAVLVANGIRPAQAHLVKAAAGESDERILKEGRGFPDQDWEAARADLQARGLLDARNRLTAHGVQTHRAIEEATDAAAAQPWHALGSEQSRLLFEALQPLAAAVVASGVIPVPSPVGMVADEIG